MSIVQDIRDTFSRRDNALNQLIVLNVVVFGVVVLLFAIAFLSGQVDGWYQVFMRQLQLSANLRTLAFHPWTILTYAFVHQSPFHILFNMLNLYYFGQIIREYLGDRRLISIYVLGALAGALAFLLAYNLLPLPLPLMGTAGVNVIGASAAVIAVVVAAATLLPNYTFMLFILGPVKIKWIAAALVFISVAAINQKNTGGEITHIGGALLGFVFIKMINLGRDMGRPVEAVLNWFSRVANPKSSMRVTHRQPVAATGRAGSAKGNATPVAGQEEIDLILDKISRSGYESLSKDEKQKLFRASQQ